MNESTDDNYRRITNTVLKIKVLHVSFVQMFVVGH